MDVASISVIDIVRTNGSGTEAHPQPITANDIEKFQSLISPTDINPKSASLEGGFIKAIQLLDSLNMGVEAISSHATSAVINGNNLSAGEILATTMRAHQFLYQSEMIANIANKTSDGVQQLFRQQS